MSRYPETPPDCLQPSTFAQRCGDCTLRNCGYLAVAEDLDRAHHDLVVPAFFTLKGVHAQIERNPDLARQLQTGNAGILFIDARGLKWLNDRYGEAVGNDLLRTAALRLGGVHEQDEGAGERSGDLGLRLGLRTIPGAFDQRPRDIGFRGGERSDELAILARNVTREELSALAARAESIFSPSQALNDYRGGRAPIIASVSCAHGSELADRASLSGIAVFDSLRAMASERNTAGKQPSYEALRDTIMEQEPDLTIAADHRLVIGQFYDLICPDFSADPRRYFGTAA